MTRLPTEIEVGDDTYALRTFDVEDGRLTSIAQRGGHWEDGKCEATCLAHPDDPDHEVPSEAARAASMPAGPSRNCSTSTWTSPATSSRSFAWRALPSRATTG